MNLLFLVPRLDVGGAQRQLLLLSSGLAAVGHRVKVATLVSGGAIEADFEERHVPVVSIGDGELPSPRLVTRLLGLLDSEPPDVLHSYLPSANVLAGLVKGVRPELPVVWGLRLTEGEGRPYGALHRITYWAERNMPWSADLMIANAPSVKASAVASGLPAQRIEVVENGFDATAFRRNPRGREVLRRRWGVGDDQRLIGLVGRIDPMKGHDVFLEAARRLAARYPDARFICVGPDPFDRRSALQEEAERVGLSDRLSWEGEGLRPGDVYSALEILCHPSIFGEGFPNAIAEAMLAETLCVVSDVGHSADLVRGVGLSVPGGDALALAAALEEALGWEADRLSEAVRAGRERVRDHFGVEALVARTEGLLEALVRRG